MHKFRLHLHKLDIRVALHNGAIDIVLYRKDAFRKLLTVRVSGLAVASRSESPHIFEDPRIRQVLLNQLGRAAVPVVPESGCVGRVVFRRNLLIRPQVCERSAIGPQEKNRGPPLVTPVHAILPLMQATLALASKQMFGMYEHMLNLLAVILADEDLRCVLLVNKGDRCMRYRHHLGNDKK
jgi:hypothetical protein